MVVLLNLNTSNSNVERFSFNRGFLQETILREGSSVAHNAASVIILTVSMSRSPRTSFRRAGGVLTALYVKDVARKTTRQISSCAMTVISLSTFIALTLLLNTYPMVLGSANGAVFVNTVAATVLGLTAPGLTTTLLVDHVTLFFSVLFVKKAMRMEN